MSFRTRSLMVSLGLAGSLILAGCETGSVRTGVYYDAVLWNDYYYGYNRPGYRPPPDRPDRPDRPVRPERPVDPGFSRPPAARPSIHRPAGGGRPSLGGRGGRR